MQTARTLSWVLAAALLAISISVAQAEVCETGAIVERLGKEPFAGSGVLWSLRDMTIRTQRGEHLIVYQTYFSRNQFFPAPGTRCKICYDTQSKYRDALPLQIPRNSRLVTSLVCAR